MTKNYSQCILLFGFEDFSENNLGLEKKKLYCNLQHNDMFRG